MFFGILAGDTISSYTSTKDHNLYCGKIVEQGTLFRELDLVAQNAVLACHHHSHAAVQMMFRFTCNTEVTEILEGRLF